MACRFSWLTKTDLLLKNGIILACVISFVNIMDCGGIYSLQLLYSNFEYE